MSSPWPGSRRALGGGARRGEREERVSRGEDRERGTGRGTGGELGCRRIGDTNGQNSALCGCRGPGCRWRGRR